MVAVSEKEKDKFRRAVWHVAGYKPTQGHFPIEDLEGDIVIVSGGQKEIHECESSVIMVSGGVRGGKSNFTAMHCAGDILVEDGLMWIIGPDYGQAKKEWEYLYHPLKKLGLISYASMPQHGQRVFRTTWGFECATKSSDAVEAIASDAPHIIAVVEAGQQSVDIFDKALERGVEHDAKIIFSGTFEESREWYKQTWKSWQGDNPIGARSFSLPTWSNTAKFPGGREDPKVKRLEAGISSPEKFLERCAAIPYIPSGAVFREFRHSKHVKRIDYNPDLPVELAIDPATHTYAILAIQWEVIDKETHVYVVDEIYEHDIIAQQVIPLVKAKPWFKDVRGGVIDIAGTHRQANKSQVQIWHEETGLQLRSHYIYINESIEVVKLRLNRGLLHFDYRLRSDKNFEGKANGTLAELELYRWRDWQEGRNSVTRPIDSNNDALKALGYWLYDRFGPVTERKKRRQRQLASYF